MPESVGYDVGTMFCQCAKQGIDGKMSITNVRNAFVEVPGGNDIEEILARNGWQWIKDGGSYYVVGEDSIQVAKLFPGKVELRRPLQDGVLNKNEDKKNIILAKIIQDQCGKAPDAKSVVCTCISSPCIDIDSADNTFHSARLKGMFSRLGWNVKIIEEGLAVVLSERPTTKDVDGKEIPYSGMGVSFGAGRANCVLAYKGMQILGMSVQRSGDWIDRQVSQQTGVPLSQVMTKKENVLDLTRNEYGDDDVMFALSAYYDAMLKYVFANFANKLKDIKTEFNYPIDIVVAGGTSMPRGFEQRVEKIVKSINLPFSINKVSKSASPRNSVVSGLLTQAEIVKRKLEKGMIQPEDI
jgi:hypothetical protein